MKVLLRISLIALGLPQALIGAWALASPRGCFGSFPGAGRQWLGSYGPYDAHLVTDVGATFLAIGALLLIAAWLLDHRTVTVSLVVYLIYSVPHLFFHLTHDDVLSTGDRIFDGALLTASVFGAFGLIWLSGRIRQPAHSPEA